MVKFLLGEGACPYKEDKDGHCSLGRSQAARNDHLHEHIGRHRSRSGSAEFAKDLALDTDTDRNNGKEKDEEDQAVVDESSWFTFANCGAFSCAGLVSSASGDVADVPAAA